MAKLQGPLMSLAASGTVGDMLTYRQTPDGSVCSRHSIPSGPPSLAQQDMRQRFLAALECYAGLSPESLELWRLAALSRGQSIQSLVVSECIRQHVYDPDFLKILAERY